jgi:hypothetical protein
MKELVLSFRPRPARVVSPPLVGERSRMIFAIGGRRYAFDFQTIVTEVNPVAAQVVSIQHKSRSRNNQGPEGV